MLGEPILTLVSSLSQAGTPECRGGNTTASNRS